MGTRRRPPVRPAERGVTLMEMLVVLAIVALAAGISYPSLTSGLDGLRLATTADALVGFLNAGVNRVERRQQVMELTIRKPEGEITLVSADGQFRREFELPADVRFGVMFPDDPNLPAEQPRRFLLVPGGAAPRIALELVTPRGDRRLVRIDPITGVPVVERPQPTGER